MNLKCYLNKDFFYVYTQTSELDILFHASWFIHFMLYLLGLP